jgi:hypothetical protein
MTKRRREKGETVNVKSETAKGETEKGEGRNGEG